MLDGWKEKNNCDLASVNLKENSSLGWYLPSKNNLEMSFAQWLQLSTTAGRLSHVKDRKDIAKERDRKRRWNINRVTERWIENVRKTKKANRESRAMLNT